MIRLCYRFKLITKSPLSVGGAYTYETDHDVLTYSDLTPYIPATSIAGSFFAKSDFEANDNFFGTKKDVAEFFESKLFVSDALFEKCEIKIRDFNRVYNEEAEKDSLNLLKKQNGKFDSEYISEDSIINFFVVYSTEDENEIGILNSKINLIISNINNGIYRLGFKQNRGFGKLEVKEVIYKKYDKSNYKEYLDFDGYNFKGDALNISFPSPNEISISVKAKLKGSILIKDYFVFEEYDQAQMTTIKNGKKVAIIPGTSINGVLQNRVRKIAKELNIEINQDEIIKTIVDEAYIEGGEEKILSRNKINRFSSNTLDKGLFTEKIWFANEDSYCTFKIRFKENNKTLIILYYLALQDLILGYAPIGGETGVGRGIFEATKSDIIVKGVEL